MFSEDQVNEHVGTLRGMRDTIGGMTGEQTPRDFDRLAGCVEALADVMEALVRALGPSKHAQAVDAVLNQGRRVVPEQGRPRVIPTGQRDESDPDTLEHGHGAVKGGDGWPEVERGRSKNHPGDKLHDIAENADPRD